MLQVLAGILQVVLNIALTAVIMEGMRNGIQIAEGWAAVVADDVIRIVVVLVEIIRVRLDVQTDALFFHNRHQLVKRAH